MPGIERLKRLQLGKEGAAGTAVAATTRWRGMVTGLDDQRVIEMVEEQVGILNGADRTRTVELLAGYELAETPLTFEQIQYLFAMGLAGPTTGVADGAGSDYIYTTNLPTTSSPAPVSYTCQVGDDFEVERAEYTVCTKISIKTQRGATAKVSGTLLARQATRLGTGFSAASIPATIEEAVSGLGKIYLDAIGGTYGTTQISNSIVASETEFEFTWAPRFYLDGQLYYGRAILVGYSAKGKLVYEHDTAADGNTGVKKIWRDQTPMLLSHKIEGGNVASAGTTYSKKTFINNLPIKFTKVGILEGNDGVNTVAAEWQSRYNATAGNAGAIIVVNELSALP